MNGIDGCRDAGPTGLETTDARLVSEHDSIQEPGSKSKSKNP
jgi:hypothetical protein